MVLAKNVNTFDAKKQVDEVSGGLETSIFLPFPSVALCLSALKGDVWKI